MQNTDEASPSINLAGRGLLSKIVITLESNRIFDQTLHTYTFKHCLDTGIQNGDETSPSLCPSGRGHLVKILTTLKPHGIF